MNSKRYNTANELHNKKINISPSQQAVPQAYLTNMPSQVMTCVLSSFLENRDLARLSTSGVTLYQGTHKNRKKRALFTQLLQAMLHDDQATFSRILDAYPEFLLAKPADYGIRELESRYTWLRYLTAGETVFSMAQQLRLIDMVKNMLPHFLNTLKDARARGDEDYVAKLKQQWIMRVPTKEEEEALQEKYFQDYIVPLLNSLAEDSTIHVGWEINPNIPHRPHVGQLQPNGIKNFSNRTYHAFETLRAELYRPKAIKDCIDINQLLIASFNAVGDANNFPNDNHGHKNQVYSIWGIGLIQSLVDVKLGKIYCEGLASVMEHKKPISFRGTSLKLHNDGWQSFFYRPKRAFHSGLGFNFCCGGGYNGGWEMHHCSFDYSHHQTLLLKNYVKQQQAECTELTRQVQQESSCANVMLNKR